MTQNGDGLDEVANTKHLGDYSRHVQHVESKAEQQIRKGNFKLIVPNVRRVEEAQRNKW